MIAVSVTAKQKKKSRLVRFGAFLLSRLYFNFQKQTFDMALHGDRTRSIQHRPNLE